MIPAFLIRAAIGIGIPQKFAKVAVVLTLVVVAVGLLFGAKALYDASVIDEHEAKIAKRAAPATDKAASERAQDTIKQSQNEQEARDAIQAQPDQPIAPTSRALACKRLRDNGINSPACR
jgi:uncharacterized membrane protein YhiD involved in acid resistance